MKKMKKILTAICAAAMLFSCAFAGNVKKASADEVSLPVVADDENLAASKWDWLTDKVGSATTEFAGGGMKMTNFNKGGSTYGVYQTHKFNSFEFNMYANLHLTRPSEAGYDQYDFDYSNMYVSFMINEDDPVAAHTCPWNGNKAYFSLCFENLQGYSKTVLYINESFVGHGEVRNVVAETNDVQWNDNEYHWYTISVTSVSDGIDITFKFDGAEMLTYKQTNKVVSIAEEDIIDVPFNTTEGYIGFWCSSDFPAGANFDTTNCYVDIQKIGITSLDGGNKTPYKVCEAPEFDITANYSFAPEASYETDNDIEIKLAELFNYEGDEKVAYEVTCGGKNLGKVNNGYWIWTPEEGGSYIVTFKAIVGEKSASNTIRLIVEEADIPEPPVTSEKPAESASAPEVDSQVSVVESVEEKDEGGCGSVVFAPLTVLAAMGVICVMKKKNHD